MTDSGAHSGVAPLDEDIPEEKSGLPLVTSKKETERLGPIGEDASLFMRRMVALVYETFVETFGMTDRISMSGRDFYSKWSYYDPRLMTHTPTVLHPLFTDDMRRYAVKTFEIDLRGRHMALLGGFVATFSKCVADLDAFEMDSGTDRCRLNTEKVRALVPVEFNESEDVFNFLCKGCFKSLGNCRHLPHVSKECGSCEKPFDVKSMKGPFDEKVHVYWNLTKD